MITTFLLLFLLVVVLLFLLFFYISFFTGAPFVTTSSVVVNEMIRVAGITKNDVVFDLGSGDGRILIAAAKKGAKAKGWEINPFLVLWTKITAHINGVGQEITVYWKNYHQANLQDATVVIFYNIPYRLPTLEKKMFRELKKGTTIISYKFPLNTFPLKKQTKSRIFLYQAQ